MQVAIEVWWLHPRSRPTSSERRWPASVTRQDAGRATAGHRRRHEDRAHRGAGRGAVPEGARPSPSSDSPAPTPPPREDTAYDTAWLQRYYPAHYTVGVLNNQPMGFYRPRSSSTTRSATASDPADRRERVRLGARHAAQRRRRTHTPSPGPAPGEGDRRAAKGTSSANASAAAASVRDFVARTRLGEQVVEAAHQHRRLRLDRCATPRALWQPRTTWPMPIQSILPWA